MKRILIISPHFPPLNYPDMQRIRMSLPYYKEYGWEPVVMAVDEDFVEGFYDPLLNETIPGDIEVHKVKAWPLRFTRKLGVGSISIRSYYKFKKKGNELLKGRKFDLIFFSTTMFHVCALGRYWKNKFNIPFIIDFQDPWRNDFYLNNPQVQKPPKFKIAYAIHKKLEAYTMPFADGLMSVSQGYIDTLVNRYPVLQKKPFIVLPFGISFTDFDMVRNKNILPTTIKLNANNINVVYIGALTPFFLVLIKAFFIAFNRNIKNPQDYHFYFIGTSYSMGAVDAPVTSLATALHIQHLVTEVTQRIPYFSAIATMMHSDILFIPGSSDSDYNASKVYNNIHSGKPIFSIFHEMSLVKQVIEETNAGIVVPINKNDDEASLVKKIENKLNDFSRLHLRNGTTDLTKLVSFGAPAMTLKQVEFFNKIVL